jgi:dTDP-4-amino-4,6-dideoxygalactose transaminase
MGMISLLPAAYGGFVVTNNDDLYEKLKIIRWHGVAYSPNEEYRHRGANFKYSDLFASMAISQLRKRDLYIEKLQNIYGLYETGLRELDFIGLIKSNINSGEVPLLNDVRSANRKQIVSYLKDHGVETCNFHAPLHQAHYLENNGGFINSRSMTSESFHLPCGPGQSIEDIEHCIRVLKKYRI